jgi:hypothetical protein
MTVATERVEVEAGIGPVVDAGADGIDSYKHHGGGIVERAEGGSRLADPSGDAFVRSVHRHRIADASTADYGRDPDASRAQRAAEAAV